MYFFFNLMQNLNSIKVLNTYPEKHNVFWFKVTEITYICSIINGVLRGAAKKFFFLVARPLRGGGVKARPLRKKDLKKKFAPYRKYNLFYLRVYFFKGLLQFWQMKSALLVQKCWWRIFFFLNPFLAILRWFRWSLSTRGVEVKYL